MRKAIFTNLIENELTEISGDAKTDNAQEMW